MQKRLRADFALSIYYKNHKPISMDQEIQFELKQCFFLLSTGFLFHMKRSIMKDRRCWNFDQVLTSNGFSWAQWCIPVDKHCFKSTIKSLVILLLNLDKFTHRYVSLLCYSPQNIVQVNKDYVKHIKKVMLRCWSFVSCQSVSLY